MLWTAPSTGIAMCHIAVFEEPLERGHTRGQIVTISLDIAKNVFQVHGIDETGEIVGSHLLG